MPTKLTDIVRDLSQRVRLFENASDYLGGAGRIDGIATLNLSAGGAASGGIFATAIINSQAHIYRLRTGTDAENSPAIIRPDDYAASTNEKVWELEGAVLQNVNVVGTLTLAADPSSALQAATKQYVDAVASGIVDTKASVRAATTANITLSGTQTIDGVALIVGDRVLVKNQTSTSDNGIYVVAAGAWARSSDADSSAEVTAGMYVFVTEGSANDNTGWLLTTNDPIVLGTTGLVFAQFSGAGAISAGNGLVKVGSTLHFALSTAYATGAIPFATSGSLMGFDTANLFWDDGQNRLGLTINTPTHTLTLGSTSTGAAYYNTVDTTTNYERAVLKWVSNAFSVSMEKGGSGINRTFNVSGTYALGSGVQTAMSITPTISQSSTAGYTALLINSTESSLGSGTNLLQDWQVGGASKASLDNAGRLSILNLAVGQASLAYAATVNIDFNGAAVQTLSLTGNVTFTTSNRGAGKSVTVEIVCDSTQR